MKIVEVSQYYPPYLGGQEAYVRNLSRSLVANGDQVTVLTTTQTNNPASEDSGVEVIRRRPLITILNNPITLSPWHHRRLLESCDIVHAHNEHSFVTLVVSLMKSKISRPLALTLHGELVFGQALLDAFEREYSATLGNLVIRCADIVFVDSVEKKQEVANGGVPVGRVVVVPNAVDVNYLDLFRSGASGAHVRNAFNIRPETRIVLFVGRLIPRKGVPILIEAFRKCLAARRDLFLVIVGEGVLRPSCVEATRAGETRGHLAVLSGISDTDLYRLYQAADLFVLPSLSEGCPTAILEAMFFGCKVVASDIPGIRNHFSDFCTLVPPRSATALSEAMLSQIDPERHESETLEYRSREVVRNEFSWVKAARTYVNAFESLRRGRG